MFRLHMFMFVLMFAISVFVCVFWYLTQNCIVKCKTRVLLWFNVRELLKEMGKMNEWTNHSEDDSLLKSARTPVAKKSSPLFSYVSSSFFVAKRCLLACIWCYKYVTGNSYNVWPQEQKQFKTCNAFGRFRFDWNRN